MIHDFQYIGFAPNEFIKAEASGLLSHLKSLSPNITDISARLEYLGTNYVCILDVTLKRGSFYSVVNDLDAIQALRKAEKSMLSKLSRQKETGFYSRNNLDELG